MLAGIDTLIHGFPSVLWTSNGYHICQPMEAIDYKFFDNFIIPNIWYRYDNSRLKATMNRSIKFR